MVRNGCGQSGHRTLKLTASQECIDGGKNFFNAGANSGKPKVASQIFGWAWSKGGHDLLVHEIVKSAKNQFMY